MQLAMQALVAQVNNLGELNSENILINIEHVKWKVSKLVHATCFESYILSNKDKNLYDCRDL